MSKAKVRTHKANIERARAGASPEAIRRQKCARKKALHEAIKEQNRADAEIRRKNRPSPQAQLNNLDFRLGVGVGAVRERKKLAERMKK